MYSLGYIISLHPYACNPFTALSIQTYLNETVYEGYITGNTSAPSLSNLRL